MSRPGDYCRAHSDTPEHMTAAGYVIAGCSGEGRPTCQAPECLYGAEPCPHGNHFRPEGGQCSWCPKSTEPQ